MRAVATALCLAGILGTAGCIGMTGKSAGSPATSGSPAIAVTPSPITFSTVVAGNSTTQVLHLMNNGTADLVVTKVTETGLAFSVSKLSLPLTVPAGGTATFSATFEPTAAGNDSGSLSIMSNADASPYVIPWSGKALAATIQLTVNPLSLPFGNITVQNSNSKQVMLTNSGTEDVAISAVSISGTGFSETGGASVTLTPGQSLPVNVSFDPKGIGTFTGTLTIASNAPNSPQQVQLSGAGIAAPAQYSVMLKWTASLPTPAAIVGYYIYRGTISGGPYARLNSTVNASTSYTDNTVASGQTYYYVVTSVDSGNVQSANSTQVSAMIP
jgi:Abnormal spindle-like microcephaly-assoc'd, ASPM-SPD-2-Hydin/Protein of unknown function (DUF1573)